ncbi:MAG: putative porin [Saprospiraceae bacterium]
MKLLFTYFILLSPIISWAQKDTTTQRKLDFTGDFRFRIEHDWDSRKANGDLRDDRSRLRYRFRFGLNYAINEHSSFGGRVRSGNINDQQGPHVTLGGGKGEFGLVQVGFEKLFYKYKRKNLTGWIGKNSIPLRKLNELFWNDNVFPEGIGIQYKLLERKKKFINLLALNAGHFIIQSNNKTFNKDGYLQMAQLDLKVLEGRVNIFPAFYAFRRIGNLPDGYQMYNLDYSIFHLGAEVKIIKASNLTLGAEYYNNLENYSNQDSIASNLRDQKKGFVISAKYGSVKKKGDWLIHLYYAWLQKFAIVDYFAQNDWARWDYSSVGATGSRISNFHGTELRIGYAIEKKFNLILRYYLVEELIKSGDFKENGSRVRLDLNIGF